MFVPDKDTELILVDSKKLDKDKDWQKGISKIEISRDSNGGSSKKIDKKKKSKLDHCLKLSIHRYQLIFHEQ